MMDEQPDGRTRRDSRAVAEDFDEEASNTPLSSSRRRRWLALSGLTVPILLVILGVFVVTRWWFEIPRAIRIGAADAETSVYYPFAEHLGRALVRRKVTLSTLSEETDGSIANAIGLSKGTFELGLIQDGALGTGDETIEPGSSTAELEIGEDVLLLAPVFPEVVHVLVWRGEADAPADASPPDQRPSGETERDDRDQATVKRLQEILIRDNGIIYRGHEKFSGMQRSANTVLRHYGVDLEELNEGDLVEEVGKRPSRTSWRYL